jgi:hypothetical protein
MNARNISGELVVNAIEIAQHRIVAPKGRQVFQSLYFDQIEQKEMLLRVIVEPSGDDQIVVSVYKTSKLRKYGFGEGRHESNL